MEKTEYLKGYHDGYQRGLMDAKLIFRKVFKKEEK